MVEKYKILIVEDELIIAHNMKSILCAEYDCVGVATTYEEAVDFLKNPSEHPHLLIIDITLKGKKTGLDLAEFVIENYQIPFIFLTAHTDKDTIEKIITINPVAYLAKPILEVSLVTTVALALKNRTEKISFNIGLQEFKIEKKNILYAETDHVYVNLYLKNNEKLLLRTSLQNLLEQLPVNVLQRINKSQAINPNLVIRKTPTEIFTGLGNFKISKAYFS